MFLTKPKNNLYIDIHLEVFKVVPVNPRRLWDDLKDPKIIKTDFGVTNQCHV